MRAERDTRFHSAGCPQTRLWVLEGFYLPQHSKEDVPPISAVLENAQQASTYL